MIARLYDDRFARLGHTGRPESPRRLEAVVSRLQQTGHWDALAPLEFAPAGPEQLAWVHQPAYLEDLAAAAAGGGPMPDPELELTPELWELARLAAGACLAAAEAAAISADLPALCLVRPPGHLAEADRSRGPCLLNHCALAAEAALRSGAERVAIVDLGAAHGAGLQEIFYSRPEVLYLSIHQLDLFPGTGTVDELGLDAGLGLTVNVPLPGGAGGAHYRRAWEELFAPLLRRFAPGLVILAAGYDAHWQDATSELRLGAADYHYLTAGLAALAREVCAGRLLVALEQGYEPQALADGMEATVRALCGEPPADEAPPPAPHPDQAARVEQYLDHALTQYRERLGL